MSGFSSDSVYFADLVISRIDEYLNTVGNDNMCSRDLWLLLIETYEEAKKDLIENQAK